MKSINLPDHAGELSIAFDGDKAGLEASKARIDKARGAAGRLKQHRPLQG